jgi:hypothetical protein
MAFILFHNHSGVTLSYSKAKLLQQVINGTVKGSVRQRTFAKRVKKIYFGRQHEQLVDGASSEWWKE